MTTEIKAPTFPESVPEGTVATWHKAAGDSVKESEVIAEIETDKVVMEVQATASGILESITKKAGETVKSQEVIGQIKEGETKPAPAPAPSKAETAAPAVTASAPKVEAAKEPISGPAARQAMTENDLKATDIVGTGKGGRITRADVLGHVNQGSRIEKRVPMTRLRATIAKRLLDVTQTTAMLTTFNEIDMHAVIDLRTRYKDQFEKTHGVKLGFMSFFVKATTEALKRFPVVNASIDGNDVVYHGYYDIGVAVSSDRGLVVPVLRSVDHLSLAEIEMGIRDYALKARDNKLELAELQGGTFTITNGGTFGSMLSTPIINAPQSAILGMHNIVERAVVVAGQIVIRPVMYVALSYDHRLIDGRDAVGFLKTIKELLEDPARLILAI